MTARKRPKKRAAGGRKPQKALKRTVYRDLRTGRFTTRAKWLRAIRADKHHIVQVPLRKGAKPLRQTPRKVAKKALVERAVGAPIAPPVEIEIRRRYPRGRSGYDTITIKVRNGEPVAVRWQIAGKRRTFEYTDKTSIARALRVVGETLD